MTQSRGTSTAVHGGPKHENRIVTVARAAKEKGTVGYAGTLAGAGIVTIGTPSGVVWMTVGLATVLALAIMTGRGPHPPNPAAGKSADPRGDREERDWQDAA